MRELEVRLRRSQEVREPDADAPAEARMRKSFLPSHCTAYTGSQPGAAGREKRLRITGKTGRSSHYRWLTKAMQ